MWDGFERGIHGAAQPPEVISAFLHNPASRPVDKVRRVPDALWITRSESLDQLRFSTGWMTLGSERVTIVDAHSYFFSFSLLNKHKDLSGHSSHKAGNWCRDPARHPGSLDP